MSPVQWWILNEYTHAAMDRKWEVGDVTGTSLFDPNYPLTYRNITESSRVYDECQAVSASMPDTISTSSSEMQSKKTSKETDEVAAQSEIIGRLFYSNGIL